MEEEKKNKKNRKGWGKGPFVTFQLPISSEYLPLQLNEQATRIGSRMNDRCLCHNIGFFMENPGVRRTLPVFVWAKVVVPR